MDTATHPRPKPVALARPASAAEAIANEIETGEDSLLGPPLDKKRSRPTVRPPLPDAHADVALGDITDVLALTRMGRSWVHAAVAAGRFPQPLRFGPRCTRWRIADVRAWLIARAEPAAADATVAAFVKERAAKASAEAGRRRIAKAVAAPVAGQ